MLLSCGKGDILSWYIEYKDKSKNDNRIAEIDYTFHFIFFEDTCWCLTVFSLTTCKLKVTAALNGYSLKMLCEKLS